MTGPALPAYLQNSNLPRVADKSIEGMGIALPPHISIRGNRFTLIDGANQEVPIDTVHLDVCVVDVSDHMCKLYYGKDYAPDSNDPPMCFSANGVAPSRDAITPQSQTCMTCPQNVRGSAVSKLTGASIKACRDEKWLAVIVPGYDIGFQFRITPGSFTNWRAYAEKFKGQPFDVRDVVTRLEFAKDANGVITFTPSSYIDEATAAQRNAMLAGKQTDALVGRNDVPIQGQLPAPQKQAEQVAVTNTPRAGETEEQTAARTRRGRPPKAVAPAAPAANAPVAPFRPEAPPPFGVAANAPAPPPEVKNAVDSFFNS